jgi:small conductance mechanosensitive channel
MNVQLAKFYNRVYPWAFEFVPKIIIAFLFLLIGLWFIRMISKWSHTAMHRRELDPSLKPFLLALMVISLRILLVLGTMQIIGIQMTLFASVIAAFGVAAGLALSGTLQNFASGILILLLKPFLVGDNIIAQGQEGTVASIQIFYTVVTTFDNRTVIIPNSKLSNEVIVNLSRQGNRRLDMIMKFNYGTDIQVIKDIIDRSVDQSKDILKTPERRIGIAEMDADGFKLLVNVWVNAHGYQDSKLMLQEKIITDLKAGGVKLPGMA